VNRERFEERHGELWSRLEALLDELDSRRADSRRASELPRLHRRLCHHLALARRRHLGADLEDRLNALALRGHDHLYRSRFGRLSRIGEFLLEGFPRLLRREARLFWLASLLLYGPAFAMGALVWENPETVYAVMDGEQVHAFEDMYGPRANQERGATDDFLMFGFYIYNNISVGFRTFAGGLLAGVGTVFFLTTNGLLFGAVAAHLTREGLGEAFWSFVVTHGAFELTAIVIAGAAGLRLGLGILAPGRRTRIRALRESAATALPLVIGAAALLVVAAFVEAFWSSARSVGPAVKAWAGAAAWLAVAAYFTCFGRRRES
jgi:uncharacterized membrane protein SpoIIM required for sporulation